ncbi:MAG: hypothetical protein M3R27_10940 [Bacteroidota bacterium]|nr:hypothetical protein [Bacteroidota bacterium]
MKKFFLVAVILIATTVSSFAGPIVTIKIAIGKNALNCDKFGICWKDSGVSVDFALVANGTSGGTQLKINEETGNLDIIIPEDVWKTKSNYFSGSTVMIDEEINLGRKISSMLQSPTTVVIKTGKYNITKDRSNNVIISIPLK